MIRVLLFTIFLLACINSTAGHKFYSWECCSGHDCRPLPADSVALTHGGYLLFTGEAVPVDDDRIRESPDGRYHWCTKDDGGVRCLYVPEGAD